MLRIISGKYSGRRITACSEFADKPTMSKVRAAIFNSLCSRIDLTSAVILDLFCGSGAFSFEAVSRGASKAYLVDKNTKYLEHIQNLALSIGISEFEYIKADLNKLPKARASCNVVFMDPPFMSGLVNQSLINLASSDWISRESIVVAECSVKDALDSALTKYNVLRYKKYGSTACYMMELA